MCAVVGNAVTIGSADEDLGKVVDAVEKTVRAQLLPAATHGGAFHSLRGEPPPAVVRASPGLLLADEVGVVARKEIP